MHIKIYKQMFRIITHAKFSTSKQNYSLDKCFLKIIFKSGTKNFGAFMQIIFIYVFSFFIVYENCYFFV